MVEEILEGVWFCSKQMCYLSIVKVLFIFVRIQIFIVGLSILILGIIGYVMFLDVK